MLIIPVIDLSRGLVVHAKQGVRDLYHPVTSKISSSAEPETVLSAFLELYPFKTIYIADLDAIQGTGNQDILIKELALQFDQCEFWVDAGIDAIHNRQADYTGNNLKPVLGSENKLPLESLTTLIKNNPDILLSLDFTENGLIENPYLLREATAWPKKVIVMMLHRVGLNKGIDLQCLNTILHLGKNNDIYTAGGVRDINDLQQLKITGVKGVLLATALHNGSITKEDLNQFLDG
jgi:phosphoribosylformimino-5-aminoimidazole carboxamide ribotide isomerase